MAMFGASGRAARLMQGIGYGRAARIGAMLAALLLPPGLAIPAVAQQPESAKPAAGAKPAAPGAKAQKKPAAQKPAPSQPAAPRPALSVPAPEVLLMLVRTTLVALNQANFTGNYTVLHGLGSPQLQARNSPADLGNAFAGLRAQNIDLSPVLVLTPQLTEQPGFTRDGALRLVGFFPSKPLQIQFVMNFLPVGDRWRIDGLSVSALAAPPAAPAPAPPPAPAKPPQ